MLISKPESSKGRSDQCFESIEVQNCSASSYAAFDSPHSYTQEKNCAAEKSFLSTQDFTTGSHIISEDILQFYIQDISHIGNRRRDSRQPAAPYCSMPPPVSDDSPWHFDAPPSSLASAPAACASFPSASPEGLVGHQGRPACMPSPTHYPPHAHVQHLSRTEPHAGPPPPCRRTPPPRPHYPEPQQWPCAPGDDDGCSLARWPGQAELPGRAAASGLAQPQAKESYGGLHAHTAGAWQLGQDLDGTAAAYSWPAPPRGRQPFPPERAASGPLAAPPPAHWHPSPWDGACAPAPRRFAGRPPPPIASESAAGQPGPPAWPGFAAPASAGAISRASAGWDHSGWAEACACGDFPAPDISVWGHDEQEGAGGGRGGDHDRRRYPAAFGSPARPALPGGGGRDGGGGGWSGPSMVGMRQLDSVGFRGH